MELAFDKGKLPWEDRPSLFEHVKTHLKGGIIYGDEQELPDNAPVRVSWEVYDPGCDDYFDLYENRNDDREVNPKFINHLVDLFIRYSKRGKLEDKIEFYNLLKDNPVVGYWEEFVDNLSDRMMKISQNSIDLVRWMVCEAPDREVVKLGIILMGLTRDPDDLGILKTLGRHDEFTFYVGQALAELTPMWDIILIDIIKPLCSFGRVLGVKLLLLNSEREETRKWCVRFGFQNFFYPDFIILDCLEYGNVLKDLRQEKWDEPLYHAAQVMVRYILRLVDIEDKTIRRGEVLYLYVKQTVGKRRGYVQYLILTEFMEFFEKAIEKPSCITNLILSEEEYSDIWIEVNREVKKKWYQKIKNGKKYFDTYPYDIEGRCSFAYEKLLEGK